MQVGAVLSPTGDWPAILEAARLADRLGLAAVGFWDHYHSQQPDWAYVCGWSAYGALAQATERIHLVPLVICQQNYAPGVLAKETSILSIVSGGRFELGIGAGDYPAEYTAWHQPFPPAATRIARLAETVTALCAIWQGGLVTFTGEHVQLTDAACTPAPPAPPRIVIGVGQSRRLIRSAVRYADELNISASEDVLRYAREAIAQSGRPIDISVYLHYEWNQWPADLAGDLATWAERGVQRAFVNIGYEANLAQRVAELARYSVSNPIG